jgi:chromosome segregation ATPase
LPSLGLIDLLAQGEEALPRMSEALEALGTATDEVTGALNESAAEVEASDARGAGFAARLAIARKLAGRLEAPAEKIEDEGREYARALLEADPAVHALLDQIDDALAAGSAATADELAEASEYLGSLLGMAAATAESRAGLEGFVEALEGISTISRDVRRPATQMRKGLQGMVDGYAVIEAWADRGRELQSRMPDGIGGRSPTLDNVGARRTWTPARRLATSWPTLPPPRLRRAQ